MKKFEKIIELGCFSLKELADSLNCCIATATSLLQSYLKKGYVERIHRDLYVAISIETKQPVLSKYQIGCKLASDAYLSHHSSLEVYGYVNQVFYDIYVATNMRFRNFTYNGVRYHRVSPTNNADIMTINNVKVSSLEQTIVDSICDIEKISGFEEIIRSIILIPSLNSERLLKALKSHKNGFLYQKCGYILESLNDFLHLPDKFFIECQKYIPNAKRYITKEHLGYVEQKKWKLFVPENIMNIINKGVEEYDIVR